MPKPSAWYILVIGLTIPGLFFSNRFYSLIRLLISIFTPRFIPANVLRLRWFAYTSASLKILTAIGMANRNAAMNQISIPVQNHQLCWLFPRLGGNNPPYPLAEIFAIGVKMKEEQDLNHLKRKVMKEKNTLTLKGKSIFI